MSVTLLDRLDGLDARYDEVSTLITDPEVIADRLRYARLTKEYSELEKILKATKSYRQALASISEGKEILASESDEEIRLLAKEEIDAAEAMIPQLEEEIKLLLIPADPDDEKNCIVEIRGGTGGDEAALFAGDLFRMYQKFAEKNGWNIAVSSFNEGAAGGYKEIIFSLTGSGVYGIMKYESGFTVCNVCPPLRLRDVSTPPLLPLRYSRKLKSLMWKSTKVKSNGTLSGAVAQVVRMSIRLNPVSVFVTTGKTPTPGSLRKSLSNVQRPATNRKIKNEPLADSGLLFTIKNIRNISMI